MRRMLAAVVASLGVLMTASLAHAQVASNLGQQGRLIISADRLVPVFSYVHASQDQAGPLSPTVNKITTTNTQTSLSLLWGSTWPASQNFYTVPRVGVDYVVVPNVTIGGNLVLFGTLGGSNDQQTDFNNGTSQTQSTSGPSTFLFGIAARGGYILQLSDMFSLWLRGGFSFYTASQKTTSTNNTATSTATNSTNQPALDLDPQFVITPFSHFGITFGLTADIPFAGRHSIDTTTTNGSNNVSTSASASSSILYLGVTAGLLGHF